MQTPRSPYRRSLSKNDALTMLARITPQQRQMIDKYIHETKKIMAIRSLRDALGLNLKEGKEFIDWYMDEGIKLSSLPPLPSPKGKKGERYGATLESALFRIELLARDMISNPESFDISSVAGLMADICEEAKGGVIDFRPSPEEEQGETQEAVARLEAFMILAQPLIQSLPGDLSDINDGLRDALERAADALKRVEDVESSIDDTDTEVECIKSDVSNVQTAVEDAAKAAEDSGVTAEGAVNMAKEAEETAENAQEIAEGAQSVADDAIGIAREAASAADDAGSDMEALDGRVGDLEAK